MNGPLPVAMVLYSTCFILILAGTAASNLSDRMPCSSRLEKTIPMSTPCGQTLDQHGDLVQTVPVLVPVSSFMYEKGCRQNRFGFSSKYRICRLPVLEPPSEEDNDFAGQPSTPMDALTSVTQMASTNVSRLPLSALEYNATQAVTNGVRSTAIKTTPSESTSKSLPITSEQTTKETAVDLSSLEPLETLPKTTAPTTSPKTSTTSKVETTTVATSTTESSPTTPSTQETVVPAPQPPAPTPGATYSSSLPSTSSISTQTAPTTSPKTSTTSKVETTTVATSTTEPSPTPSMPSSQPPTSTPEATHSPSLPSTNSISTQTAPTTSPKTSTTSKVKTTTMVTSTTEPSPTTPSTPATSMSSSQPPTSTPEATNSISSEMPTSPSPTRIHGTSGFLRETTSSTKQETTEAAGVYKIFITDHQEKTILWADLDGPNSMEFSVLLSLQGKPSDVTFDTVEQMVYWSDKESKKIWRANVVEKHQEQVTQANTADEPLGIVIAEQSRLLFCAYESQGWINSVELGYSNLETQFVSGINKPVALAIDEQNGYLYWSRHDGVDRKRLAGTDEPVEIVYLSGFTKIYGLAINPNGTRLFLCDEHTKEALYVDVNRPDYPITLIGSEEDLDGLRDVNLGADEGSLYFLQSYNTRIWEMDDYEGQRNLNIKVEKSFGDPLRMHIARVYV